MNLLLLRPSDKLDQGQVVISDYRAEHIIHVLKLAVGSRITIGETNGLVGYGYIQTISAKAVTLGNISLTAQPPPQLDVELVLALPRPRMLQRTLQTVATMGVKTLHLIHTERVEKSFWQTPLLKPVAIEAQFALGLEQARATQPPKLHLHPKWRPFSQNQLDLFTEHTKIIAHPGDYPNATALPKAPTVLAIGPEGGFTEAEVARFIDAGFSPVQLGDRILRVETAVPVLLAKLF